MGEEELASELSRDGQQAAIRDRCCFDFIILDTRSQGDLNIDVQSKSAVALKCQAPFAFVYV
jgi:hypothetical protein